MLDLLFCYFSSWEPFVLLFLLSLDATSTHYSAAASGAEYSSAE